MYSRKKKKGQPVLEKEKGRGRRESGGTCASSLGGRRSPDVDGRSKDEEKKDPDLSEEGLTVGGLGLKFIPRRMSQIDPALIRKVKGDVSKLKPENLANKEFVSYRPLPMNENFRNL